MSTLQKFKILATQCAIAGSPARSPTTSPLIHLRRRKTLRMLLGGRSGSGRRLPSREETEDRQRTAAASAANSPGKSKELTVRQKLKDLFVSSPPQERGTEKLTDLGERLLLPGTDAAGGGMEGPRGGRRYLRPLSATLRQRLLRRAWRPVLVGIPE